MVFTAPTGAHSAEINHLHVDPLATYLSEVGKGLWSGARVIVAFLVAFIAIALLVFWKPVLNPYPMNSNASTANYFVSIYFLAFIGSAVFGVV